MVICDKIPINWYFIVQEKFFNLQKLNSINMKKIFILLFVSLALFSCEKEEDNNSENADALEGKVFVITGSLSHFNNRNELKDLIESMGGKVTGSVTGNTSYLINNDVTSTSSKNKNASKLGIPIISEEEFLDIAGRKDLM